MKKIFPFCIFLFCSFFGFSQTQELNKEYAKHQLKTYPEYAEHLAAFEVYSITETDLTNIKLNFLDLKGVIDMNYDAANNRFYVYYITKINLQELKDVLVSYNVFKEFINTRAVNSSDSKLK
jgi:hypothetical protein